MFRKSNLFAIFVLSLSTAAVYAQQPGVTTPPTVPTPPTPVVKGFTFSSLDGGSYMGVQMQEVTKDNFSKFGLREVRGVVVEKVTENSPAAQAGLQNGDVIVRFEGEEVTSVRKLQRLVSEVAPDHQAKVTILRDGKDRDFTITLGKRPTPTFMNGSFTTGAPLTITAVPNITIPKITMPPMTVMPVMPGARAFNLTPNGDNMVWGYAFGRTIGIGTTSLTKQLGEHFGVADGKGILINNVRENSPAAKAGLKAGDVIVEANGKAVTDTMELMKALNSKEKGAVTITVIRDKNRQTVTVEPEENKDGNKIQLKLGTPKPISSVLTVAPNAEPISITTLPIEIK